MYENEHIEGIFKGATIIFIGLIISKLFGYGYRVILSRLGAEAYGNLSLAIAITALLAYFSLLGMNEGLIRFIPSAKVKKEDDKIKGYILTTLKISSPISVLMAIGLFLSSNYISINLFHNQNLILILKIMALAIPFDSIRSIFINALIGFKRTDYMSYSKNIFESFIKLILTAFLIYLGYGIIGAAIAYIIAILIGLIISLYYLEKKVSPFISKKIASKYDIKTLMTYSWPLLFIGVAVNLIGWIDSFMIGYFKDTTQVGIYNAALPTAALLYILPSTLITIFFPTITQLKTEEQHEKLKDTYKTITKWIFFINIIPLALFILFPKQILNIIFKEQYISGYFALSVISIGYFIHFLSRTSERLLLVFKKSKLIFYNFILAIIVNIILNIILIPKYGINGAAIATSSSYILLALLNWIEAYIYSKLNPFKLNYIKSVVSIIIAIIIVTILRNNLNESLGILILYPIIFTIIYVLGLVLTKAFEKEDMLIINLIKNKFTKNNLKDNL